MLFAEGIKQLRDERRMPQCQYCTALETHTPMYNKLNVTNAVHNANRLLRDCEIFTN